MLYSVRRCLSTTHHKIYYILLLVIFFLPMSLHAKDTTWLAFELLEYPYYDPRDGTILESLEGRKNDYRTPFEGGGKIYPSIPFEILERYEQGNNLLVKVVGDLTTVDAFTCKTTEHERILTYKKIKKNRRPVKYFRQNTLAYNFQDFKPKKLTDKEAATMKSITFGISLDVDLGATD